MHKRQEKANMIPEEIEKLKPTEFGEVKILESEGRYNVFMNVSKTVQTRGRSRMVTGICIGSITAEEGFVPNDTGEEYLASKNKAVVKSIGGYELLRQLSPGLEQKVRKVFPGMYREIISMALMNAVWNVTVIGTLQDLYDCSVLSEWYPGLELDDDVQMDVHERTGRNRKAILDYMSSWIKETETEDTAVLLTGLKSMYELCSDDKKYMEELGDITTPCDYGRLFVDFVAAQYFFMLDYVLAEKDGFTQPETILQIANLVFLVTTPDGKYMTAIPDKLEDFLDKMQPEHHVSLSIDQYLL